MATANSTRVQPDHVIIWCDKNRAVEEDNRAETAVLENNADLNYSPSDADALEIQRLIVDINLNLNERRYHRLIRDPLRRFRDESECLEYIHDSMRNGKQPFLITSGQKGALLLPRLLEETTGRLLQQLRGKTYVFCAQRQLHQSWTKPLENDIEIYDDEKGVFGKVLLDIGIHYLTKGMNTTGSSEDATQYFRWARRLVESATRVDGIDRTDYLTSIHDELSDLNVAAGYDSDDVGTAATDEILNDSTEYNFRVFNSVCL